MRTTLVILALALGSVPAAGMAETAASAAPASKGFSVSDTDLGTLLDNAGSKAVLEKYIAAMIGNPQIDMARSMTLKQLQSFAGDVLTDETLAKIQADLDKLPR